MTIKFGSGDLKFKTASKFEKQYQKINKKAEELLIMKNHKNAKIDIEDKFSKLKRFANHPFDIFSIKIVLQSIYIVE